MAHSNLVQSVQRALALLREAVRREDGLSLGEAARILNVKKPTAFNLIRTLLHEGFLRKTEQPVRFHPGPALEELMQMRMHRQWLNKSEQMIRFIHSHVPQATILASELVGGEIVVRFRMDPARPGILERNPPRFLPPYTTATGICFLIFAPEPELSLYRRRHPFSEYGAYAWQSEEAFDQFCRKAREAGIVELCPSPPWRIAAPIIDDNSRMVGVLGASLQHTDSPAPEECARLKQIFLQALSQFS